MEDEYELVPLPGGGCSLREVRNGETYHPGLGPLAEAEMLHVGPHRAVARVIWDIGLGAGANAVAWLNRLSALGSSAELHSFDLTLGPLRFAIREAASLGYPLRWLPAMECLAAEHRAAVGDVTWHLHLGDLTRTIDTVPAPEPEAIAFDPYSAKANPGIWSLEFFRQLRARIGEGRACTLSSYSRSTPVRLSLMVAGFEVGRGPVIGEKEQSTVAATHRELLEAPLGEEWLGRARRSTRSGVRLQDGRLRPLIDEEWAHIDRVCRT